MQLRSQGNHKDAYLEIALLGYAEPSSAADDRLLCLVRSEAAWDDTPGRKGSDALDGTLLAGDAFQLAAGFDILATSSPTTPPDLFVFRDFGVRFLDTWYTDDQICLTMETTCTPWKGIAPFTWPSSEAPLSAGSVLDIFLSPDEWHRVAQTLAEEAS